MAHEAARNGALCARGSRPACERTPRSTAATRYAQLRAMGSSVSKYRLWTIVLCPALLIALGCAFYFGPQVQVYLEMRRIGGPPGLWEIPRPLAITGVSTSQVTPLSYFGYKFEVPWVGIEKEWGDGRWVRILFKSGQEVFFSNPDYSQHDVLLLDSKFEPDVFRKAFESPPAGSKYEHMRAVLSMTPSKLSPFRSHRRFARERIWLGSKGLWLEHSTATHIFEIQTPEYKGFETTSIPQNGSAEIILFDASDRMFSIGISGAKLAQSDMNTIIQSFGPPPSTTSNPTPN